MNTAKLEWNWDESCACYRAYDDFAIYVISEDKENAFTVGYFPSPGGECKWKSGIRSLEDAKNEAEDCVEHVAKIREEMGS